MFQRNEAAQDVPVALVTKLLPPFFFFFVRMNHHFKRFSDFLACMAKTNLRFRNTHTHFI